VGKQVEEEEEEGVGGEGERDSADGEEECMLAQRILDALQPGEELAALFREPYASTTDRICELNQSHELACVADAGGICEHNRSVEVEFVGDAPADICEHNRAAGICEHNRSLEVGQRVRVVGLVEDTQVLSLLALLVQKYKH
jgi:hypothetical protein